MIRWLPLSLAPAIVIAFAVMPAFAAQGTPSPSPGTGIAPVVWQLTRFENANGLTVEPDDPSLYTVQFLPDGKANVRADCNNGQGNYEIDGSSLMIEEIVTTLVGCPPESFGEEFVQHLQEVESFAYAEEELVLSLASLGGVLHFVPSLIGVIWEWQEFLGGNMQQIIPDDPSKYTITFDTEGKFAVRADCNVGSGTYTVDGPSIDMTVGPLTRAKCPPESHSERFLRDLEDTTSYTFRDGRLYLALMADAGISTFAARAITDEGTPEAGEGTPIGG
jgi:heat shock protein HslJ